MPRVIMYEPSDVQAEYAALVEGEVHQGKRIGFGTRGDLLETARTNAETPDKPPPTQPVQEDAVSGKDDFLAKIAKYVPAETITLTTLAFAATSPSDNWIWIVAGLGAVANVAYLFTTALASPATPLPRWQFYVLSVVAYAFWAAAIIGPIGEKVGIKGDNAETKQTFALALAAFIVPALDSFWTNLPRLKEKKKKP